MGFTAYSSLVVNGLMAFGLNFASLTASGKVGALAMAVAGAIISISLHSLILIRF